MPAQPPSDDSQLPQLRRFRFDPESAKVPREVTPAAEPEQLEGARSGREIPTSADDDPGVAAGRGDDDLIDDPDRLLADADRTLDQRAPERPAPPVSGVREQPARATAQRPGSGPGERGFSAPERPIRPADRAGRPPSGPVSTQSGAAEPKRPSTLPWLLAGLAAAVVIALVIWFVTASGSDDEKGASGSAGSSEAAATVETAEWAQGVCEQLTAYETTALPLKAEATKAAAASGGAFSAEAAKDMQREAGELLIELSSTLGQLPIPADDAIAGVHDQLLADVTETAQSTQASGNGAIGSPRDTAADVVESLSVPLEAFATAADELTDEQYTQIAEAPSCEGLL